MVAVADRLYVEAKLRDARAAEKRTLARAERMFGEENGRKIVRRAVIIAARRIRDDNLAVFR